MVKVKVKNQLNVAPYITVLESRPTVSLQFFETLSRLISAYYSNKMLVLQVLRKNEAMEMHERLFERLPHVAI